MTATTHDSNDKRVLYLQTILEVLLLRQRNEEVEENILLEKLDEIWYSMSPAETSYICRLIIMAGIKETLDIKKLKDALATLTQNKEQHKE